MKSKTGKHLLQHCCEHVVLQDLFVHSIQVSMLHFEDQSFLPTWQLRFFMCYLNCAVSFVLLAKAVLSLSTECEALRLLGTSLSGLNAGTQLQIVIGLLSCGTLRGAVVNSNSVLAHPIGSSGLAIWQLAPHVWNCSQKARGHSCSSQLQFS